MKTIVAHNASDFFGGGEIWLCRFLAELQRRGQRVLLLCRNDEIVARAAAYDIPADRFHIGGVIMLPDALRFARRLRHAQADVVLLTTFKKTFVGALGARLAGVPRVLARVGISTIRPHSLIYRVTLRRLVDAVVVNAEEIRQGFLQSMPNLAAERVITIHNGVVEPVTSAPPDALRRELGLPRSARVIGTLARLEHQKRLHRLVRATARLPDDVHCVLAGEGSERPDLEALAVELGVRERVHFVGFRHDVRSVLDALDVFVLASDWEGLSTSMLQAMSAGVPVVSTHVSGTGVALAGAPGGVAPGVIVGFDVDEIANALRTLLDDPVLRTRMGAAGKERVRVRFSFDRMMEEWKQVLGLRPSLHDEGTGLSTTPTVA